MGLSVVQTAPIDAFAGFRQEVNIFDSGAGGGTPGIEIGTPAQGEETGETAPAIPAWVAPAIAFAVVFFMRK